MTAHESLPADLFAACAMILAERAARIEAEAQAAHAVAENSNSDALIATLKLQIKKLRRELHRQPLGTQGAAARSNGA